MDNTGILDCCFGLGPYVREAAATSMSDWDKSSDISTPEVVRVVSHSISHMMHPGFAVQVVIR